MEAKIFYSWQSDSPNATNRSLIQDALEAAAKAIRRDGTTSVEPVVDRDTAAVAGSPDIVATIFRKIGDAAIFVADVSLINVPQSEGQRLTPNPNVLVELGFAIATLGWSRVILVCNKAFGGPEDLPFDLRQRRAVCYRSLETDSSRAEPRKQLTTSLQDRLQEIFAEQSSSVEASPAEIATSVVLQNEWFEQQRGTVVAERERRGLPGTMELRFSPFLALNKPPRELLQIARDAAIHDFGWPLGIVLNNDYGPKPRQDGIFVEIGYKPERYHYWALRKNGDFFLSLTMIEEEANVHELFFDTHVLRVAESLLYARRLYNGFGLDDKTGIHYEMALEGLADRVISAQNRNRHVVPAVTQEDTSRVEVTVRLEEIRDDLAGQVIRIAEPLFELFDFRRFERPVYEGVIETLYPAGKYR